MSARVLLLLATIVCFLVVAFDDADVAGVNLAGLGAALFAAAFVDRD